MLVGRERAIGSVNGELYTFVGHRDDGRLELVRLRDEKRVVWDLHEHRAIDHGYATTSYRSQGRTVDAVFALASTAEARRGLYVDVTSGIIVRSLSFRVDTQTRLKFLQLKLLQLLTCHRQ